MKLGLPSKDVDDDTRILVVEVDGNTVGMVVDSATEVLHIEGEKVQAAPDMITSGIDHNYIDGVGLLDEKRLLTLLDLSKVMLSADYEKVLKAQQMGQQHMLKKDLDKPTSKEYKNETPVAEEATSKESSPTPEEVSDDLEGKEKESKTSSKK
jgi:hypothetical protein